MPHGNALVAAARYIWLPTAVLVAIALWGLGAIAFVPHHSMGMAHSGTLISYVVSGSSFDKAGIRAGDRFEDDAEFHRFFHDAELVDYRGTYHLTIHRGNAT